MVKPTPVIQSQELFQGSAIFLSAIVLKKGRASHVHNKAAAKANPATNNDSLKKRPISWLRREPTVLRMPTSRARFSDLAVDKFIKLIQASTSTTLPMIPNSQTYWIR